jgi:hypothetical protein
MDWIVDNLNWLVPTLILLLGAVGGLAFKYPDTFPKTLGLQLIVWAFSS